MLHRSWSAPAPQELWRDWVTPDQQRPRRPGPGSVDADRNRHYMLGTIADRNHTVVRDLSGLRPLS